MPGSFVIYHKRTSKAIRQPNVHIVVEHIRFGGFVGMGGGKHQHSRNTFAGLAYGSGITGIEYEKQFPEPFFLAQAVDDALHFKAVNKLVTAPTSMCFVNRVHTRISTDYRAL